MTSAFFPSPYTPDAMIGRPPTKPAPPFGQRLAAQRRARGLSQRQLAERLSTTREVVDYYERRAQNPTLDFVQRAAEALDTSVAELLGDSVPRARKQPGPNGKVRQVFEQVSRLPRRQQEKIADVVSALVSQYEQSRQQ